MMAIGLTQVATAGAAGVLLVGAARRLRPAPHEIVAPTSHELDDAAEAIDRQAATSPNLVYLRDKGLLFAEDRAGFVMYGIHGRSWIAMGDPVGPERSVSGLVRGFLERCDHYGGVPVFYAIRPTYLHCYAGYGLTFVKLGEEAKVNLTTFTMDGGAASRYRHAVRHLEKEGGSFRVVPRDQVPVLMPQLRAVSDEWLRLKAGAEKGFSMGFFDEGYLQRFPVAVIERGHRVQAFCNLWLGARKGELSPDLMRYSGAAPADVMEALLVHIMVWGKTGGYRQCALGMAPLSGLEESPSATLWNRLGSFLYEHGEAVYGFQGLRAFKDKFNPTWEPRYLAYPGGLRLPLILADASALIAGGYRRILLK